MPTRRSLERISASRQRLASSRDCPLSINGCLEYFDFDEIPHRVLHRVRGGCRRVGVRAADAQPGAGGHDRPRQVPLRQRHRSAQQEEVADRARVLQAGHRDVHAERDTYLGEGTAEALVLAINEFKEFLTFYPTNPRSDYAQYKLGLAHYRQMRAPQRDQSETRETVKEFETFVERYPNSKLMPEVRAKLREAKDRLDESNYLVGFFYYRQRWYLGAADRFKAVLKEDPAFTKRDAVYFHLGESLIKQKKEAEALPYFEKLLQEFEQSEYLQEAQKRVAELKAQAQSK
ncbi:MAG: hypothetical protein DMG03_23870 [Acidobacteria bacterium]|nr:MAG: hypothetical protein DMG03_23870 [Acidobacteriota bacterium]